VSDRYKEMWEDAFHDNLEKKAEISELQAENSRLKAEVERLTKAGDELHAFLIDYIIDARISSVSLNKLDDNWLNAKKGGQP
jgi:hypothetical protein